MKHARMIVEDTPAFIPAPSELQHRKTEIIFLPLDDELTWESAPVKAVLEMPNETFEAKKESSLLMSDAFFKSLPEIETKTPPSITDLMGKVPPCFNSATEVDAFIRAERDAWDD